MKKFIFMFAACAAISFASCGDNKTTVDESVANESAAQVEEPAADSEAAVDSNVVVSE